MFRLAIPVALLLLTACQSDDVGQCCKVQEGRSADLIPMPVKNANGTFIDDIAKDPAFLCENFTCVSFNGSMAYCTKSCISDDTCPEGFTCSSVLNSDPGPDANIQPSDKFCVKLEMAATCEP